MGAVHVRIGHDDDFVVAQLFNVKILADTAAKAEASFLFIEESIAEKAPAISYACELLADPIVFASKDANAGLKPLLDEGRDLFAHNSEVYFNAEIDPLAMGLLVFTSGTTGKGKGVMLCTDSLIKDMTAIIPYIDFSFKTIAVLPPHHTYGSTTMLIAHVIIGAEVYISAYGAEPWNEKYDKESAEKYILENNLSNVQLLNYLKLVRLYLQR